ncbi:alkaline serine protease alp1 [Colletotrichum truncatum]|uniref:Alkaline serine protease alp1 n=1 Tax=Colletotrichum truncatum TaxID=5467 RepID=A0ACC3ZIT3_COLTU|nr:alkaline serine protease alp1 [Colletotrichum truncatum]KAF6791832.1 alkaline serine protease alp1 [Colletotrichum truncatum]
MSHFSAAAVLLAFSLQAIAAAVPNAAPDGVIPGQYIVRLKPGLQPAEVQEHLSWAAAVHERSPRRRDTTGVGKSFTIGEFNAYAGHFDEDSIAEIGAGAGVISVEPNRVVELDSLATQKAAPWGLASLSTPSRPPDSSDSRPYKFDDSSGEGTFAYVVDTGIHISHPDFAGRAIRGYNAQPDEEFDDFGGHGTHVAGIVGSQTYGVVKNATIVDVKVLVGGGSGTVQTVLDGYNWAVSNITQTPGRLTKSVINLSLGFTVSSQSSALDDAVQAAYGLGIVTVVSAGNGNQDAVQRSPARAKHAITVAASDWKRARAGFSNYGPSVDIFAPGVGIRSLTIDDGYASRDGTSQATPHITGLIAYLRSQEELATPKAVLEKLKALAISNVVQDAKGAANLFAYNGVRGFIKGVTR